jgi:hypothetical protein
MQYSTAALAALVAACALAFPACDKDTTGRAGVALIQDFGHSPPPPPPTYSGSGHRKHSGGTVTTFTPHRHANDPPNPWVAKQPMSHNDFVAQQQAARAAQQKAATAAAVKQAAAKHAAAKQAAARAPGAPNPNAVWVPPYTCPVTGKWIAGHWKKN